MKDLIIKDLYVSVEGKKILEGVDLTVGKGQVVALMGPNGSGKSTLAMVLLGHPKYTVEKGTITFEGKDITTLSTDKRAKLGLFLSFQYPVEVPGVTVSNFLRTTMKSMGGKEPSFKEFGALLREKMALLKMDEAFATRYLNEGFSGGEKKLAEILQLAMLQPQMAILDETDSGLDVDALKVVSQGINSLRGPGMGVLLITHYQRILNYVKPDRVYVMNKGRIIRSGGKELAEQIEKEGYDRILANK